MALIKCSECGHMVSDKAESCPNCGNPIVAEEANVKKSDIKDANFVSNDERDNPRTWKWILGIVVCLIIACLGLKVLLSSNGTGDRQDNVIVNPDSLAGSTTAGSDIDENDNVQVEYNDEPKKIGYWYYSAKKDPMTDELSYMAINISTNKNKVCGKSTNLSIYLHYENIGLVGLGLQGGMFRTEKLPMAYIRFDDGEIETYSVCADTPQNVYLMQYDELVRKLKGAKKVTVKIECGDGGTSTFTFNVEGLHWNHGNDDSEDKVKNNRGEKANGKNGESCPSWLEGRWIESDKTEGPVV